MAKSMIRRPGRAPTRPRRIQAPTREERAAVLAAVNQAFDGVGADHKPRRDEPRQAPHPGAELARTPRTSPARRHDIERRQRIHTGRRARRMPYTLTAATAAAGYSAWGVAELAETVAGPGAHLLATTTTGLVAGTVVAAIRTAKRATITGAWRARFWCAGAGATSWVTVASVDGAGWGMLAGLAAGAAACSGKWQHHHQVPLPGAPEPPAPAGDTDEVAELGARWAANVARANQLVPGSTLTDGQRFEGDGGAGIAYHCQLSGGMTLQEVQSRATKIASAMGLDPMQLVFDYPPKAEGEQWRDASRIRMQVVTTSPITEVVHWTKPTYRAYPDGTGRIGLGPYADGRGWSTYELFKRNGIRNGVIIGSTGGGKSALLNGLVASGRSSGMVKVLYLDPKGDSSPELAQAATVSLLGLEQAEEFTQAVEALLRGRAYENAANGWSGFTPSRERPAYWVVVDECDMLFELPTMAARWGRIAKTGRSKGIGLLLATQYAGQKAFGGASGEMLRSNVAAGNVILMRTESNTSDRLIAPGMPSSRSLPDDPGYGYIKAADARQAPFRAAFLPSVQDEPDGFNALSALLAHPDAEFDAVGAKACEALFVADPAERQRFSEHDARRKLAEFLADGPATMPVEPAAGGGLDELVGAVPSALGAGNVIPIRRAAVPVVSGDDDEWVALTANERQVLAVLGDGHGQVGEIVEVSGLAQATVSRTLARLSELGRASKQGGRKGQWVAT